MLYLKGKEDIIDDLRNGFKKMRISKNFTQKELASRSGVSFGSLKRFEISGQISLDALVKLAIVLDCQNCFDAFSQIKEEYKTIEDVYQEDKNKQRVRHGKKS